MRWCVILPFAFTICELLDELLAARLTGRDNTGGMTQFVHRIDNAPNYAQFGALCVPELVAYYTQTQVLDGLEDQRRLRDDQLLIDTGNGDIRAFAAAANRDYYRFKVDLCEQRANQLTFWFRRPANITKRRQDYLFPWDIGAEVRLFTAYSREFVCKGRVNSMWRQNPGKELSATGAIVLVNIEPAKGGLGRRVYETMCAADQ